MRKYFLENINRLREDVVKKHTFLYNEINEYYNEYFKYVDMSFNEKVWYWFNDISSIVLCEECNTKRPKFNDSWKKGYKNFCSVKCASSSKKTKEKIVATNIEKYGVAYYTKTLEYAKKCEDTSQNKYGVSHFLKSKKVRDEIIKTNIEKYGHDYGTQSEEIKTKMKQTKQKNTSVKYDLLNIDYDIIYNNDSLYITHKNCGSSFSITRKMLYDRMKYNNVCDICNMNNKSYKEDEVYSYISNCIGKDNIKTSDRTVLSGKELDIYIPDLNLAVEFNGLYWHSELYKDKNYHLNKSIECEKKGIQLLHIFEDDWIFKRDIVKSIIKNKLGKIDNKIYARKCEVREVKSHIAREFLDSNHIQGFSKSTYKLGLYYNNELISLMTFGYRKTNSKKEFELIRFCNKLDTNVVGASSKLFKYFLSKYSDKIEESYILSYADTAMFDGAMYDTLGFNEIHLTKPNYFWVVDKKREHRWKYNKQNLIKEGFDGSKTEVEIMHSRGYYRIWSTGQKRYEFIL